MSIGNYRISVHYPARLMCSLDEIVDRVVRKRAWASGCGFGERDKSYDFKTAAARDAAIKRLERAAIVQVTVKAYDDTED